VWIAVVCSEKGFTNLEASKLGVFNRVVAELNLGWNNIGDNGANGDRGGAEGQQGVLTKLVLSGNRIGDPPKVLR
jgi:hypothetical protein